MSSFTILDQFRQISGQCAREDRLKRRPSGNTKIGDSQFQIRVLSQRINTLRDMQYSKDTGVSVNTILADASKGESNRNPTINQVQYMYPYFNLHGYTNQFFLSNKLWDICTLGMDQESYINRFHSSNNLKSLFDKG